MPKYQAIIFDLDDTLVKTGSVKQAHHKAVAKEFYGHDLTDEVLAKHWGMPFDDMILIFNQHADSIENLGAAYEKLDHRFPKALFPDSLTSVVALLDAGCQIGVLSAMNRNIVVRDLTQLGFPVGQFLFIQGADDTSVHKPHPGVFAPALEILRTRHISPSRTLYIGDALTDFYAARDAGIGFLGVTTGFASSAQFSSAKAKTVPNLASAIELLLDPKTPKISA